MIPNIENNTNAGRTLFWQFNRYEPAKECNAAIAEGDWKLFFPFIPEARVKLKSDGYWPGKMLEIPHFEMELNQETVERTLSPPSPPELYNLNDDLEEKNDLSADNSELVKRLRNELDCWFQKVNKERVNKMSKEI